jgi:hypothetical protein
VWQTTLSTYIGTTAPFEIEADILKLYSYAVESWQKQGFGGLLGLYVENFLDAVKGYTNEGKDQDAQASFQRIVPKNRLRIAVATVPRFTCCGIHLTDGILEILFNSDRFGYNVDEMANEYRLAVFVDSSESPSFAIHGMLNFYIFVKV